MNKPLTPEVLAEWRETAKNTVMISALGEYTPEEFTVLLDEVDTLRSLLAEAHPMLSHYCSGCYDDEAHELAKKISLAVPGVCE